MKRGVHGTARSAAWGGGKWRGPGKTNATPPLLFFVVVLGRSLVLEEMNGCGEIELRGPRVVGRRLRVVYADGEPVWLGEGDMIVWYVGLWKSVWGVQSVVGKGGWMSD